MSESHEGILRHSDASSEHSTESSEELGKYLYHRVPPQLVGDALYPLNMLRESHPDVYQKEAAKYAGREALMQERIPKLNVLWNDVLHLTPVHPRELRQAYLEAGGKKFPTEWYRIPAISLNAAQAVIFRGSFSDPEHGLQEQDIAPFDVDNLAPYTTLPDETRQYYKEELTAGKRPLLFLHVPHVLYRKSINIADCTKITV